ncbi:MAG: hypothetical protein ACKV1O_23040 [Saprospiraceae bacterium]
MTNITLQVDREDDLRLLLELVRRLNLGVVQVSPKQAMPITPDRQRMIDFILSYTNDRPSFGDAATWQNQERSERELPWQA